jgi:hypothetical protein
MDLQAKISVAGIDLKASHLRILKFIISYYLKDQLYFTKEVHARIQIIEIQLNNAYEKLEEYKKNHPNVFFIIISESEIVCNTAITIQNPISPRKLLETLRNALLKLENIESKKNKISFKNKIINKKTKKLVLTQIENKKKCFHTNCPIEKNAFEQKKTNIDLPVEKEKPPIKKESNNKLIKIDTNNASFTSSRPDIDLNNLELLTKKSYKTDDYLQGKLFNIYNNPNYNHIRTAYGFIIYNKKNHTTHISVNDRTLQNISSIATLSVDCSMTHIEHLSEQKTVQWEDADKVLWRVSIWASRGRLPLLFNDLDREFTLIYWPNLTRFIMTPHAMEIAALWSKKPISLRKSLLLLQLPQRYIFSFYSATIALDLILFNNEKNPLIKHPSEAENLPKQTAPKRKGVFSKLLNFFKPNNIEDI